MISTLRLLVIIGCVSFPFAGLFAEDPHVAGQEAKLPLSFGVRMDVGGVFSTNDFVKGGHYDLIKQSWEYAAEREVHDFSDVIIQMNCGVRPDRWQARAYRNPYYGVGIAFPRFHDERLGKPISVFGTYGARIAYITRWLKLNYEINFGYSTNWNHYDRFKNPDNVAVGWKHNAHISFFPYLKFVIPGGLDLKAGVSLTHFSNGATTMPNRGLNNYAASVALSYNLNDSENKVRKDTSLHAPHVPLRLEHDVTLTRSFRQIYYDGRGTDLSTQFVQYRHPIFAASYAPMLRCSYRYRCGLSLDFMYDESVGARADYVLDEADGKMYERVWLGNKRDRFNLGLSAKNELIMYGFSFFLNIGYDIMHGDESLTRMYEVVGVKIHPKGPLYASVGVRAAYFSKAQYVAWSVGYNFMGKPLKREDR